MSNLIYLFHSPGKFKFHNGVFSEKKRAADGIAKHQLTGVLTRYPIDTGVYDWAVASNMFVPKKPHETTPEFIGGFTTASQEHWHYENGICEDGSED